jgi:protein O-mannosyl-transferase
MPPAPRPTSAPTPDLLRRLLVLLGLVAVVFVCYLPSLRGGFVWDDDGHVTRAELRSLEGLGRIWFDVGATQQYYPVLHSAFWLEHQLWGDAPLGYRLMNILGHAGVAWLFGLLLLRLRAPGAWVAAFLFAVHPICVETVAWVSEQKNTLSALLYLGGALAYWRYRDDRTPRRYALASALFALALLTKSVTATLPAALLVLTWWREGRIDWRRELPPLLPWFGAALAMGSLTAYFEHELIGANGSEFTLGPLARGLLAGRVVWFYLGKLLIPAPLLFVYPRWGVDPGIWWQWLYPLAAVAGLGIAWLQARRGQRAVLAALLLFGGTLFPVLGFFNVFPFVFSYVADHFQYLASLPVFALAGWGLHWLGGRFGRSATVGSTAAVLAACAALTWSQSALYRSSHALYTATLEGNPDAWLAHQNLAVEAAAAGTPAEAVPHLEAVLRLKPDYVPAMNYLGDDLIQLGRAADAVPVLQRALRLRPQYADAHNNLGRALMAVGREADGLTEFGEAVRLDPKLGSAQGNLGMALASAGRVTEALPHFQAAVRLQPDNPMTLLDLATALTLSGHFPEAAPHFEHALALAPENPDFLFQYGHALLENGQTEKAAAQLEEAVRLNPGHAMAHWQLALALRRLGRSAEALEHQRAALELDPSLRR